MMDQVNKMLASHDDAGIGAFMESHDGFDLIDQGFAEIEEQPTAFTRGKSYVELDAETVRLLNELVMSGRCSDIQHAMIQAIRAYTLAVLPQSYTLVRTQ